MPTKKGLALRIVLGLGLLAAAVPAAPSAAHACGDVFVPEIDHRIQGLASAEKTLREGSSVAAAQSVVRMFPEIRSINPGKDGMLGRAQRTLAIALVREDGAIDLDVTWRGRTAEQKKKNLAWAVSALERAKQQRPNDPSVETDLAEALAKVDDRHDEARRTLQSLADRDLVASPHGYAALARLQKEAGDDKARELAVQRCTAMAKDPAICKVGAAGPQS